MFWHRAYTRRYASGAFFRDTDCSATYKNRKMRDVFFFDNN